MNASTTAALRIASMYLALSGLWVVASDWLLVRWLPPERLAVAQTVKGLFFMTVVSLLLFWWVRRELRARDASLATLRSAEARLGVMLNQTMTGVFIIRDDGFVHVNARFAELFGCRAEDVVGRRAAAVVREVVHEAERSRVLARITRTLRRGEPQMFGFRGLRPDGAVLHLEAQTTRFATDGESALLGIVLDVTQRRVVEAQYETARRLEVIGRMAGSLAHDINNLLTAIGGAAELMRARGRIPHDSEEDLQVILDTTQRGASLARQLLAFSRSRARHAEPIDVNQTVRGMMPMIERLTDGVRLALRLDERVPIVVADKHQIEQLVLNLVVNARDAVSPGGQIEIATSAVAAADAPPEASAVAPGGELLRLAVTDSGPGIPEDVRPRIFEPFFTTKGEQDTGLGLATVQRVVAQTGGQILLESRPGHTCFSIYLPGEELSDAAVARASHLAASGRGSKRVLVVEDEPVARAVTRRALERAGFVVVEASTAEHVRAALPELATFDVVLLDPSFRDASGADLARLFAGHPAAPPIVLMAGFQPDPPPIPDDVETAGFIEKPFTVDDITNAVLRAAS